MCNIKKLSRVPGFSSIPPIAILNVFCELYSQMKDVCGCSNLYFVDVSTMPLLSLITAVRVKNGNGTSAGHLLILERVVFCFLLNQSVAVVVSSNMFYVQKLPIQTGVWKSSHIRRVQHILNIQDQSDLTLCDNFGNK